MKKYSHCFVMVLLLTALLIGITDTSMGKPITLKSAMFYPYTPRNAAWKLYVDWCKSMKVRTNGELIINFVGGTRTIPWQNQISAIKNDGVIDMSWMIPTSYKRAIPEAVCFPVSEITTQEERKIGIYEFMNERHHPFGLHLLGRIPGPGVVFFTNKLIKDPKTDFKGLKWGVTGTMWNPFCNALGIVPTMVPPREKYSAMERGVIDGLGISSVGARSMALQEVAKYRIDHIFWKGGGMVVVISYKVWKTLPKHLQDLLIKEHTNLEKEMASLLPNLIEKERAYLTKNGVKMIKFSPKDEEWYLKIAKESKWAELKELFPESYMKIRTWLSK